MGLTTQILLGTTVLGICALAHISVLVFGVWFLQALGQRLASKTDVTKWFSLLSSAFAIVVLGHTLQAWLWAISFLAVDALPTLGDAIYFALVTTTTLGYGDIILNESHRVFGAMAATAGLLTFGLSTAFLIKVFERFMANK